ncbi:unnamed protein product [Rotaria sordida]|uniref:Serine aminopeptidase S33 domain-containing protein n=1 Tax=Rotaria sordida TaxID=392033 RepID=A0A813Z524_9BILA|nr:unnamed protein product [Rotaria sordida]CAF1087402.1 unnamed protein product [Rotaria sordida]CAF1257059.1 unnamed protein product [Rotaria sordida]CAF1299734.1 unnamed protein product [Rotaria sordida]CAF1300504.1 unnamed protein product [Rotaria sordida]
MDNKIEFDISSHDGLRLAGYNWSSYQHSDSPIAVIIFLHGVAEHCGRYKHFTHFFNENNIAVVSMDLRGHGLSEGEHVFIPTAEAIYKDIDLLIEETRYRYPSCPAILYGHSMGGCLALSYTLNRYPNVSDKCPYQTIIVSSPWIRLARFLQPPYPIHSIIQTVSRISPSLRFPLRFKSTKITRDENIAYSYNEDPYIRRSATLSLAHTMGSQAKMLDQSKCIFHIPVLIQHGTADAITSHDASLKFAHRGKNIYFKSWPDCYHELHNEPEREEIFHFILHWIYEKIIV